MPLSHLKRTIEISTPGTQLSVKYDQLVIQRPNMPVATVPIEEIGIVVVDDIRASYTQSVFVRLIESKVCVVVTGGNHMPLGMMLPIQGHHAPVPVQRKQIKMTEPHKKRMWRSIVQSKIFQQSLVLHQFNGQDMGLSALVKRVRSGDVSNVEAQAAKRYWTALFGPKFRRDQSQSGLNATLNYGYAIVRGVVARALVSTGLLPSIGLHHHNRSDAFCLADDLLEPFRPFVDKIVKSIQTGSADSSMITLDDRSVRTQLLSTLTEKVEIDGISTPLSLAVGITAASLGKCVLDQEQELVLPSTKEMKSPKKAQPVPASYRKSSQNRTSRSYERG